MRSNLRRRILFISVAVFLTAVPGRSTAAEFTSDLQERSQEAFRKGKNLYDRGRYAEAFREWDAALPSLEGQSVKKTIEFLKSRVKDVVVEPAPVIPSPEPIVSPKETARAVSGVSAALPAIAPQTERPVIRFPEGFKETLAKAEQKTVKENRAAAQQVARDRKEKERVVKLQKELNASFEKGKKAFENGKIDQAVSEWEKILPHLADPSKVTNRLGLLRRSQRHLAKLKEIGRRPQKKFSPSAQTAAISKELSGLLEASNADLVAGVKHQMKAREDLRLEAQKKDEESARLKKEFESGRELLQQGDYGRAAQAWEKILPSLGSQEELRKKLNELKENRRRAKEISALLAVREVRTLPLEEAAQELEMNELLQKEALSLQEVIRELEAKRSAFKTAPSPDTRLRQVEVEMEPLLRAANAKLAEDAALGPLENHQFFLEKKLPEPSARRKEAKKMRELEAAQAVERKKLWVRSTFEDGKAMYELGRSREAFLLWGTLTPYLDKEPAIRDYIKKASK